MLWDHLVSEPDLLGSHHSTCVPWRGAGGRLLLNLRLRQIIAEILPAWKPLPSFMDTGACGLINISFACLMRTEAFLRGLYWIVCKVGATSVRRQHQRQGALGLLQIAKCLRPGSRYWPAQFLYHAPGGFHAGCGTSGFIWILRQYIRTAPSKNDLRHACLTGAVMFAQNG